jgi:hypothetical protein
VPGSFFLGWIVVGKAIAVLVLGLSAAAAGASIGRAGEGLRPALDANRLIVEVDWQGPQSLPRRFRNHCSYDGFGRRSYCSDHCGFDYQFYYCSRVSFGCCSVGLGYCDWHGLLRCHP